ncbi:ribonuclease H [Senna tora]|uniref:Ribonuclease H n=1 Tax=Senna tora TaxID=362788 RepID=A0A834TRY7_9FABA|nr:ribonuclease H [Senna tora]
MSSTTIFLRELAVEIEQDSGLTIGFRELRVFGIMLPTISKYASWSATNPVCLWCSNSRETNVHAIRDCPKIAAIWRVFLNPWDKALFFNLSTKDWIGWNLKGNYNFASIYWPSIFSAACGLIWQWRNKEHFDADFQVPNEVHRVILYHTKVHDEAWRPSEEDRGTSFDNDKAWRKPMVGWIKVNTDGVVCRSSRKAGCGGIIRDNYGNCFKGFVSNLGYALVLSAKLWGLYHGLVSAWNLGFRKMELEISFSQAIKMIQTLREAVSNLNPLQHKISCLLARDWEVKATHIPRNANGCANTIAKHSLASSIGFNMLDNPLCVVVSVMLRDANNSIIHDPGG